MITHRYRAAQLRSIYLDYNATTPLAPEVYDAMLPYLVEHFGNPSSSHVYGVQAREAVERARVETAQLIGCQPEEVIFTSGATESNNQAIRGILEKRRHRGNHIITSVIEHPAVLRVCAYLEKIGIEITRLPVDEMGLVNVNDVERAITRRTILVSVMHANNEVGTIQPIAEIAAIAHNHDILVHTDAAQSVGKIATQVDQLNVDLLSIAGHKMYAPKGVGALYIRSGILAEKLLYGADQENGRRAGTENVPGIVGLGTACALARRTMAVESERQKTLRDRLEQRLLSSVPELKVNGHPDRRLPNTLSISFPGHRADHVLAEAKGLAASTGAACHDSTTEPSHVLTAMQLEPGHAAGTLRLTLGRPTTATEIEQAANLLVAAAKKLLQRLKLGTSVPI